MSSVAGSFMLCALLVGQGGFGQPAGPLDRGGVGDLRPEGVDPAFPGGPAQPRNQPVLAGVEHFGFTLVGQRGRHYLFGGIAVADYQVDGQRYIVSLQEDPNQLARRDRERFRFFIEIGTGHQWAIGSEGSEDGLFPIYFRLNRQRAQGLDNQAAPRWQLFHEARYVKDARVRDGNQRGLDGGNAQARPGGLDDLQFTQPRLRQDPRIGQQPSWTYVPQVVSGGCCGN